MRTGRKTKLTPEVENIILTAIRLGMTYARACEYAKINESTYYRWIEQGEKAKSGKFKEFCEKIKKAQSDGIAHNLGIIQRAAKGGDIITEIHVKVDDKGNEIERKTIKKEMGPVWQASSWLLERRHPSEFGRKDRIEVGDIEDVDRLINVGIARLADQAKDGDPSEDQ